MQEILRGLAWSKPAEKDDCTANYKHAVLDRLLAMAQHERAVAEWMLEFYANSHEAPSQKMAYDHFVAAGRVDESTLVEDLGGVALQVGASYKQAFENAVEKQHTSHLSHVCRTAVEIADQGIQVGQVTVQGAEAAVSHLYTELRTPPKVNVSGVKTSMQESQEAFGDIIEDRRNDSTDATGVTTGFNLYDKSTNGIRPTQLYVHAGFYSHLKTTSMFNMVVASAVAGWNPLVFEGEMPSPECMMICTGIHSTDPKFAGHEPINVKALMMGKLSDEDHQWVLEVYDDLVNNKDHGEIRIVPPNEFTTWGSCVQRLMREHARKEVDILWLDYITRMPVDAKHKKMDLIWGRNETIREMKEFAGKFDNGNGIPICTLFQINRDGWRKGIKDGGRLDKTSLHQYNAVEQEADVITYIWYDDAEKLASKPKIGIMKSRYGEAINIPQEVTICEASRRISDMQPRSRLAPTAGMAGATGVEI